MDVNISNNWYHNISDFGNVSLNNPEWQEDTSTTIMTIVSMVIACVGIITNSTVVIVFLINKKFRSKIPIIYIINQVRIFTFQHAVYYQLQCYQFTYLTKFRKLSHKRFPGRVFCLGCI